MSDAQAETAEHEYQARSSRRMELVGAVICVAVSALVVVMAGRIEIRHETGGVDPRWWPTMLGYGAIGLSLLLLVVAVLRQPFARDDLTSSTRLGWTRFGVAVLATAVFVVLWGALSFVLVLPFYLAGLLVLFGGRGWKALIAFPVGTTAFIYLLFHTLLRVPL